MVLVDERIPQSEDVMFVVRVALVIELCKCTTFQIDDATYLDELLTSSRMVTSIIL